MQPARRSPNAGDPRSDLDPGAARAVRARTGTAGASAVTSPRDVFPSGGEAGCVLGPAPSRGPKIAASARDGGCGGGFDIDPGRACRGGSGPWVPRHGTGNARPGAARFEVGPHGSSGLVPAARAAPSGARFDRGPHRAEPAGSAFDIRAGIARLLPVSPRVPDGPSDALVSRAAEALGADLANEPDGPAGPFAGDAAARDRTGPIRRPVRPPRVPRLAVSADASGFLSLPGGAPDAQRQRASSGPTELFACEAAALDREGPFGRSVRPPLASSAATGPVASGFDSIRGTTGFLSLSGTMLRADHARELGSPTRLFKCEHAAPDREGPIGPSVRLPLESSASTGPVASGFGATEGSLEGRSGSGVALRVYRRHGCGSPAKHFSSVVGVRDPASLWIRRPEAYRRRSTLLPVAAVSGAEPRDRVPRPDRAVLGVGQPMPTAGFG